MKFDVFSIGMDTYWAQFDGLLDRLTGYHAEIHDRIAGIGVEMVDNSRKAADAAALYVDFLFVSIYMLSTTVLPVVQKTNVPVVMLDLQPVVQLTMRPSMPWVTEAK